MINFEIIPVAKIINIVIILIVPVGKKDRCTLAKFSSEKAISRDIFMPNPKFDSNHSNPKVA
jgi:hypothetical protein